MIIGSLLYIVYYFLLVMLAFLPSGVAVPSSWSSGIGVIWGYLNSFSFIVPVDTLVICLGLAFSFHLFLFIWHAVHWVYSLIRGYHY